MKTLVHASASVCKATSRFILVMLLAGISATAMAQQAPLKVAVLDMASALFNSDMAKKMDEQINSETSSDQEKVRSLAQEATTLQEKLQKDGSVMSDEEKRKASEQIEEIGVQYQFLVQKIQKLVQERRQQFQQTYAPNLIQAITAIVEEENYDIVLRSDAALHYRTSFDITARVTEKLNQQQQ